MNPGYMTYNAVEGFLTYTYRTLYERHGRIMPLAYFATYVAALRRIYRQQRVNLETGLAQASTDEGVVRVRLYF